jgi:hypothetical protein
MDPKHLQGLMEAYSEVYAPIDEAVKGESSERRRDLAAQRRAGDKPLSPAKGRDNANKMQRDINYFDKLTKKNNNEEVEIFDTVLEFLQVEGYAETLEEAEWLMANVIDEEAIDIIIGEGKLPLDKEKRTKIGNQIGKRLQSSGSEIIGSGSAFMPKGIRNNLRQSAAKKVGEVKKMMGALKSAQKEEYMDEAQEARNNPEKYEREQSKKYAPVRGERTPMPPRGDKRREDFEKWYAANVR